MKRQDILQALKEKGVVETRTKGFPMTEMLSGHEGCDLLVIGMDDEPYVQTESALFRSQPEEIFEAIRIVARVLESRLVRILVDSDFPLLQSRLGPLLEHRDHDELKIELKRVEARFPVSSAAKTTLAVDRSTRKPSGSILRP
jgi:Na+-translocating ferredoxin:NAD+ oxidoreductase RnfC subunit